MHADLQRIVDDLRGLTRDVAALAAGIPEDRWGARPSPERWSVAENVAHLNLTTDAYLGMIDAMLAEARAKGSAAGPRMRKDFVGWLLHGMLAPGKGGRVKTAAAFIPDAVKPKAELMADWERYQEALVERVAAADGLPIDKVKIASPFSARVRYNGYACFAILAQHERRHLAQARTAWDDVRGGTVPS